MKMFASIINYEHSHLLSAFSNPHIDFGGTNKMYHTYTLEGWNRRKVEIEGWKGSLFIVIRDFT